MKQRRILKKTGSLNTQFGSLDFFIYSDGRSRRMKMHWQNDRGLVIVITRRQSVESALDFMNKNINWIESRQRDWKTIENRPDVPDFKLNGQAMYRGRMIPVNHTTDHSGHPSVTFDEAAITIKNLDKIADDIPFLVKELLIRQARIELPNRVYDYAKHLRIPIKNVSIRDQRTRWGSWSSRQNMSLNWRLIMLPDSLINYVILHELTHSLHPNHSIEFWNALETICIQCKVKRDELKNYVHLISLFR